MKKYFITSFVFILIFCNISLSLTTAAYEPPAGEFTVSADAAVLLNLDTNDIIYEKNITKSMHPASITKIMTSVLAIESGEDLDSTVLAVPDYCLKILQGTDSSLSGLKSGEELTLRQYLYSLLMASGNDSANVLADHFGGGDISKFVDKMNARAKALGMKSTTYKNPHGLTADGHMTTVEDLVILTRHAMTLPLFLEIVQTSRYEIPPTNKNTQTRRLSNSNFLIDSTTSYYYKYAKGIKTGFTDPAGRCLVSTASKDGYRYLAIVMGCPENGPDGKKLAKRQDFTDTINLYDWAFGSFEYKHLLTGEEHVADLGVELSWEVDSIQLIPEKPLTAIIPKDANASTIEFIINIPKKTIESPVKKGTVYGTADVTYAGEVIGTINLIASESAERSLILLIYKRLRVAAATTAFKLIAALLGVLLVVLIILNIIRNKRRQRRRVRTHRRT